MSGRLLSQSGSCAWKRGEPSALSLLGFGERPSVAIQNARLEPARVTIGGSVAVHVELRSTSRETQELLVDLVVHFVKANGRTRPKVFKLKRLTLAPGASVKLEAKVSFASMTTRRHFPGTHQLDAIINGVTHPLTQFEELR